MFRRSNQHIKFTALLALATLILFSSVALAKDHHPKGVKVEKTEDTIIITTMGDDGDYETQVIDLSGIGEMVDEALAGLESSQFQLRLGRDNIVSLAMDDTAIELDLDVIMAQVGAALSQGLDEFHTSQWASSGPRDESRLADDELVAEMDKLRAEMRSLKRELKKLRTD